MNKISVEVLFANKIVSTNRVSYFLSIISYDKKGIRSDSSHFAPWELRLGLWLPWYWEFNLIFSSILAFSPCFCTFGMS